MNVAVFIGGASNGFDTPLSGESRYAYNLASMLSYYGHSVDCIGTGDSTHDPPSWGTSKVVKRVNFIHPRDIDTDVVYDVALNVPWTHQKYDTTVPGYWRPVETCLSLDLKAKLFVHVSFSWKPAFDETVIRCYKDPHKHIIAHPYPSKEHASSSGRKFALLPFPFCESLPNEVQNPNTRDKIVWTCKNVFSDEWDKDRPLHHEGVKVLEALKNVSNNFNLEVHFVSGDTFFSQRAKRLGVVNILARMENKVIHKELIPKSYLDSLLSKSRFIPLMPKYGGSCMDAACVGAVPLAYKNSNLYTYDSIIEKSSLLDYSMDAKQIETIFSRVITDDVYYTDLANSTLKSVKVFTYESSHSKFLDLVKEYS